MVVLPSQMLLIGDVDLTLGLTWHSTNVTSVNNMCLVVGDTVTCEKMVSISGITMILPPMAVVNLGWYQYQTYGISLCRGDVATTDCKTCVKEASNEIHRLCPYDKGAIIWYDNCLLKYSNKNFLGQIDNENLFSLLNVQNVSDPTIFNQKTRELLSQLATEASVTTKKYAAGHIELGESTNVYGLAQCTWDLSSNDCFQCLEDAIGQLPSCCDGKEGGRVVGGSCNIRYEIYPFLSS
nr:cysteine-rich repeat secretory protein 38 [Quercus suber]